MDEIFFNYFPWIKFYQIVIITSWQHAENITMSMFRLPTDTYVSARCVVEHKLPTITYENTLLFKNTHRSLCNPSSSLCNIYQHVRHTIHELNTLCPACNYRDRRHALNVRLHVESNVPTISNQNPPLPFSRFAMTCHFLLDVSMHWILFGQDPSIWFNRTVTVAQMMIGERERERQKVKKRKEKEKEMSERSENRVKRGKSLRKWKNARDIKVPVVVESCGCHRYVTISARP